MNGQRHRVRDGVVHMDELHVHAAQLDVGARRGYMELGGAVQIVLLQLALNQANGQSRAVHRHVQLLQKVGHRADVVLMAVGDHHAPDALPILLHKGEIGDHAVHAGHILIGEGEAAVHDDHVPLAFIHSKVFSDLIEPPQEVHLDSRLLGLPGPAPAALGGLLFLGRLLGPQGLHLGGGLAQHGLLGPSAPPAGGLAGTFCLFSASSLFRRLALRLFRLCPFGLALLFRGLAAGALAAALCLLGACNFSNLGRLLRPAQDLVLLARPFLCRRAAACAVILSFLFCHLLFLLKRGLSSLFLLHLLLLS